MKKTFIFRLSFPLFLLLIGCGLTLLLSGCTSPLPEIRVPAGETSFSVTLLGSPYGAVSDNGAIPWDLCLYDGCLYVGAGDYDTNQPPKEALRYSPDQHGFESAGAIPDEQIHRFLTVGGRLTLPGLDPTGSWDMGNYYVLTENGFVTHAVLPGAVHTFDLAEFDGSLFAAIGTNRSSYPLLVSREGSEFTPVPFYRNGEPVSTAHPQWLNRIYDLFVFKNGLYACYRQELYRYCPENGGCFDYVADWNSKIAVPAGAYVPILAKAEGGGRYFFTTGTLYMADDLAEPVAVTPAGYDKVTDLAVAHGRLYLLAHRKTADGYESALLFYDPNNDFLSPVLPEPTLLFTFTDTQPAFSFCAEADAPVFYVGLGQIGERDDATGRILRIAP